MTRDARVLPESAPSEPRTAGEPISRRDVLTLTSSALLSTALTAAAGAAGCRPTESPMTAHPSPSSHSATAGASSSRLPVLFVPHGGGPWPFVPTGFGTQGEQDALAAYLRSVGSVATPRAILAVSAHWEMPVPTVMTAPRPPMLYDYYGFPEASYSITWPAPGSPELAARVRELLGAAGLDSAEDGERGFDHGTFVPLKLAFPDAQIPTVQLSLVRGLDPAAHLALGRALAPLRDEGVLIVGSGMSFHNMRGFRPSGPPDPRSVGFDDWLKETALLPATERDARLTAWDAAPYGRFCHPREEHLLPLHVIAGAAGSDRGRVAFNGSYAGSQLTALQFDA